VREGALESRASSFCLCLGRNRNKEDCKVFLVRMYHSNTLDPFKTMTAVSSVFCHPGIGNVSSGAKTVFWPLNFADFSNCLLTFCLEPVVEGSLYIVNQTE